MGEIETENKSLTALSKECADPTSAEAPYGRSSIIQLLQSQTVSACFIDRLLEPACRRQLRQNPVFSFQPLTTLHFQLPAAEAPTSCRSCSTSVMPGPWALSKSNASGMSILCFGADGKDSGVSVTLGKVLCLKISRSEPRVVRLLNTFASCIFPPPMRVFSSAPSNFAAQFQERKTVIVNRKTVRIPQHGNL